jgi:hypothetical protein
MEKTMGATFWQSETFWKRMWLVAAWHNFIGVAILVFGRNWIYTSAGEPEPAPILSLHYDTWIGLVLVFGIAYYMVYKNMYQSRSLVIVGILGKITSATPQLIYLILYPDRYPTMLIGPIITDYAFAFFYWRFLKFLDERGVREAEVV